MDQVCVLKFLILPHVTVCTSETAVQETCSLTGNIPSKVPVRKSLIPPRMSPHTSRDAHIRIVPSQWQHSIYGMRKPMVPPHVRLLNHGESDIKAVLSHWHEHVYDPPKLLILPRTKIQSGEINLILYNCSSISMRCKNFDGHLTGTGMVMIYQSC